MENEKPVLLTQEGIARLSEELQDLVEVRRPEIVARVASAREEGDLAENFSYHDARRELGMLDGRVQTIEAMLRNAELLQVTVGKVVGVGSTVTIKDEFGKAEYFMVGPVEADVAKGRISIASPLGSALMGKTVGNKVTFKTPVGPRSVSITGVR